MMRIIMRILGSSRIMLRRGTAHIGAAVAVWLCGALSRAYAQAAPPTMDEISDAVNRDTDKSFEILRWVFGKFAESPFTEIGTPDSMLGHVFLIGNLIIFALGAVWLTYHVASGIMQTAHEGQVLGKRMSSLWVPIRMSVGVSGMMPIFGGFSVLQAVMMYFTLLGIGGANMGLRASIDAAANYAPLVQSDAMVHPMGTGVMAPDVADTLFMSQVCVLANRAYDSPTGYSTSALLTDNLDSGRGARQNSIYGERLCGGVQLTGSSITGTDNARSDDTAWDSLVYRVASVDYAAIAAQGRTAMVGQLRSLDKTTASVAVAWFVGYQRALEDGKPIPEWPAKELMAARKSALALWKKAAANSPGSPPAIRAEITRKIKEDGWAVLGAWSSTFAEANAAIVDAANAYTVVATAPGSRVGFSLSEIGAQLRTWGGRALAATGLGEVPQTDQVWDALHALQQKREAAPPKSTCLFDGWETATGNCSMGQMIALTMINGIAADSGGDGLVNPIIASKNLGDYLMTIPQAVYAGGKLATLIPTGRAASAVTGVAGKLAGDGLLKAFGSDLMGFLTKLLFAMFIVGAVLSVYVPLIPFVTWMTALVGYFAVVIEGLVAAQIMAFSHLSSEGEGMGPRTERGYVHGSNVLLRPILMVVGFFIANAMLIAMGTLFNQLFGAAISNVQGNSTTGLATIVGMMVVYLIALVVMVQSIFNLVYEVPDRALGWIGSSMEARFGRELDNKIEGLAHTSIRWAGGVPLGGGR